MSDERKPVTVGSSDVAPILGLSPWREPVEVWAQLVGLLPRYGSDATAEQRRGHIIEPALVGHYARTRGVELVPGPPITEPPIVAPDGWRACRPDATTPDRRLVVEAKTTRRWDGWGPEGSDGVPVHYAAQVAWQLSVMDAEAGALIAYCPMDDEVRVYDIRRNRALEERLVARVRAWMEAHVWPTEPVQPAPLPMALVASRHAEGGHEGLVEPDAHDLMLARRLAHLRAAGKALDAEAERIQAVLCERIGESRGLRGIATWSAQDGREMIDTKRLRAEWPEVAAQVTSTGKPSRRFTFSFSEED
ncbi:MAG: YqaJ viral recombinase family protein [Deltaproteobacteria bacterium]|nr:YqaJ viral recombinase family protein [Deltaproteobacteria bacterium]